MPAPLQSAVLIPVFRAHGGEWHVVLIRRVNRGAHAGEIALPGGKHEPGDASLAATAIRETAEEIGACPAGIEVLESLPSVHTRVTGFEIHPFLARIEPPACWVPEPGEVATVLPLPVTDLLRPGARRRERFTPPGAVAASEFPCLRLGPVRIWGATYRILDPVLPRLGANDPAPPRAAGGPA